MTTVYTVLGLPIEVWNREDWQLPDRPITGPAATPDLVHWGICHYPGASRSWQPPLDTASHLRWANDLYLSDPNRGYSYGYGFVIGANPIDWARRPVLFDTWEVRGFDIRIASNNGDFPPWSNFEDPNFNGRSLSVQIMCSFDHPPTPDQRLQFRYMMALCDQVYAETVTVQPHQASDQTDCPGPAMDVMAELATRPPTTAPDPTPVPQPDDTDQFLTLTGGHVDRITRIGDQFFLVTGTAVQPKTRWQAEYLINQGHVRDLVKPRRLLKPLTVDTVTEVGEAQLRAMGRLVPGADPAV